MHIFKHMVGLLSLAAALVGCGLAPVLLDVPAPSLVTGIDAIDAAPARKT